MNIENKQVYSSHIIVKTILQIETKIEINNY